MLVKVVASATPPTLTTDVERNPDPTSVTVVAALPAAILEGAIDAIVGAAGEAPPTGGEVVLEELPQPAVTSKADRMAQQNSPEFFIRCR